MFGSALGWKCEDGELFILSRKQQTVITTF